MANHSRTHAKKVTPKKERTLFIDLPAKTQKTIGLIVAGVIVLLFACVILKQYDLLPKFNGRLRYYDGEIYGVEDGILYANKSKTTKARIFPVAEYCDPEGYVSDVEAIRSSSKATTICLGREVKPVEETDKRLVYITVKGVEMPWDDKVESILPYNSVTNEDGTVVPPEQFEGESENGLKFKAVLNKGQYNQATGYYERFMLCYVKAGHGCSVSVIPVFRAASEDQLPDAQYMLDIAKDVMKGITIK